MATFHIRQQSGTIQQADVIHNHGGLPGELAGQLALLIEELNTPAVRGDGRSQRAAAELVGALEEASSPQADPGRVRSALDRAAGLLAGVASAAGIVTSLEAIVAALPHG
ncbi:hypothetical protein ACIREE_31970 [Streptomyces sp. NPDC102467]|uniref:hypothetical protein n=1 Tax=Streptomyces sp. NPDC102467 TaxID=3366179 RepID=UPI00380AE384